jgi:hypothetical protein
VLQDPAARAQLEAFRPAAAAEASPLRILDVILWISRSETAAAHWVREQAEMAASRLHLRLCLAGGTLNRDQHRRASRGMQTCRVRREVPDQRRPACQRRHGKIIARFGQGFSQWCRRPGEGRADGPLHRRQESALTCLAGPARESVSQDAQHVSEPPPAVRPGISR